VLYYPHLWVLTALTAVGLRLVETEALRATSEQIVTPEPAPIMHPAMEAVLRRSRTPV